MKTKLFLTTLLFALVFVSCKKDKQADNLTKLPGTWKGTTVVGSDTKAWEVSLSADGKITSTQWRQFSGNLDGSWTLNGNTITLKFNFLCGCFVTYVAEASGSVDFNAGKISGTYTDTQTYLNNSATSSGTFTLQKQ